MKNNESEQQLAIDYLIKCGRQRASIMAMIYCIMDPNLDKPLKEIRAMITAQLAENIEAGLAVGDDIEFKVLEQVKLFIETELAVENAKDLVGE